MSGFRRQFALTPDELNRDAYGMASADVPKLIQTWRQRITSQTSEPFFLNLDAAAALTIGRESDLPAVAITPNNTKEKIILSVEAPLLLPMRGPIRIEPANGYRSADAAYDDLLEIDVWEAPPRAFPLARPPKRSSYISETDEGGPTSLFVSTRGRRRAQIAVKATGSAGNVDVIFVWASQGPGQSIGFSSWSGQKVIDTIVLANEGDSDFRQYDWGTSGGPGLAPDYILLQPSVINVAMAVEVSE